MVIEDVEEHVIVKSKKDAEKVTVLYLNLLKISKFVHFDENKL